MLTAIIQARTHSTRLPHKVLLDIEGKPMLWWVVERVKRAVPRVVVAYPHSASGPISELCRKYDWDHFEDCRSDENDVLARYYRCACRFGADPIVRVTSDCPLIDPGVIRAVVLEFQEGRYDYVSNNLVWTFPVGLDVEVFSFDALEEAHEDATDPYHREHVTEYIRETPGFSLGNVVYRKPPGDWANPPEVQRWTVDTHEDLDRVRALVRQYGDVESWEEML